MTENELIKTHIEECEERIGRILGYMETAEDADTKFCERNVEVLKSAVIALEEIQQYRAIRLTPTMVKDLIASEKKAHKIALENADILDEYRAIGTIEEIKEKLSLLEKYEELGTVEELDEVLNMFC